MVLLGGSCWRLLNKRWRPLTVILCISRPRQKCCAVCLRCLLFLMARFGVVADFLAVALGAVLATTVLAGVGLRRGDALARGL